MCSILDDQASKSRSLCSGPSGSSRKADVSSPLGGSNPSGTNKVSWLAGRRIRRRRLHGRTWYRSGLRLELRLRLCLRLLDHRGRGLLREDRLLGLAREKALEL